MPRMFICKGDAVVVASRTYMQKGPGKSLPAGSVGTVVELWTHYSETSDGRRVPTMEVALVEFDDDYQGAGGSYANVNVRALKRSWVKASRSASAKRRR